ncbi:Fur family transcriptional regulator [Geobacter sp. AOG2]|uniref:Fur family transcriptional regulator n=1 Tax=Geobacter sp. AOG2 TaxID=1566347 RepID=UPI001CC63676|nr:Fur family transcriptional regulator [Geobacter sp. AOG2]GFE59782.1 transcriptional repressor [Geobacter sp. AOG2]
MDALQEQLKQFGDACRKAGLKLTHQRLEIFSELARSPDHPSAEALHQRLRKKIPTLSLDTVYRTLATFVHHGMINKVETIESQGRFEVTLARHHHLICSRCNAIMDFQWPFMDEAALPEIVKTWGRVDNRSVVVYGICKNCLDG